MRRVSLVQMLCRFVVRYVMLAALAYCGVGFVQWPGVTARAEWTDTLVDEITRFEADVTVHKNGIVTVRETIEVRSYVEIRHGIIRRIPTRSWNETWPSFTPVTFRGVSRDGRPEFYAIRDNSGELRIRIGTDRHVVGSGLHRYEIVYEIDNVVQSLGNVDQFMWNATGKFWPFNIRHVTVRVHVEGNPTLLQYGARVGRAPKGEPVVPWQQAERRTHVVASSDRTLSPGTSFHVGLQWPASVVHTRPWWRRLLAYSSENYITSTRLTALLLFALFAFVTHVRRWLQPKNPTSPSGPPAGCGPVELRYILQRTCDPKCLAVAIASMQSKGAVTIEQRQDGVHVLRLSNANAPLTHAERTVSNVLFAGTANEVALDDSSAESLYWTKSFLRTRLRKHFPWAEKALRLPMWAWVFSVAVVFSSCAAGDDQAGMRVILGLALSVLCSWGASVFWRYGVSCRPQGFSAKVIVWGTLGLSASACWAVAPVVIFLWWDWASAVVWLGAYALLGWSYLSLRRDPPMVEKIRNEARAYATLFNTSLGADTPNYRRGAPRSGRPFRIGLHHWPYALALDAEHAWAHIDRFKTSAFMRTGQPADAFSGAMTALGPAVAAQAAHDVVSLYEQHEELRSRYREPSPHAGTWSSDSTSTSSDWGGGDGGGGDWGGGDSGGDGGGGGGDGW